MENNKSYLVIDPYVYMNAASKRLLMYNPLNGQYIIDKDCQSIQSLLAPLFSVEHLNMVELSPGDLQNMKLQKLILEIKNKFMGDFIPATKKNRPFIFKPLVDYKSDLRYKDDADSYLRGNKVLENLTELTLIIDNAPLFSADLSNIFEYAYLQFPAPIVAGEKRYELDADMLDLIYQEVRLAQIKKINIVCCRPYTYGHLARLNGMLEAMGPAVNFHFPLSSIFTAELSKLKEWICVNRKITLLISLDSDIKNISEKIDRLKRLETPIVYGFILRSEEDLNKCMELCEMHHGIEVKYLPLYDKRNREFFEKHIYIQEEALIDSRPTLKQIYTREHFNPLELGNITIAYDGAIYTNVNQSRKGEIGRTPISKIVYDEIFNNGVWKLTRNKVEPCKACLYHSICPPISNYEKVIGKYNLCHVYSDSA